MPGSTELARIYSAASRLVAAETRFSFLLTVAAVTLSKRMQFHLSGGGRREGGRATFCLREENTQPCVSRRDLGRGDDVTEKVLTDERTALST